jgi:FAD/FMN-containing dehydrogenase
MTAVAEQVPLDETALAELQAGFRGRLVAQNDPAYDEHRKIWNGSIDRHPALIARCAGVADVIAAVRFCRQTGLPVAVRSGGHSFPGICVADDALLIDLGLMKGIRVDPPARTARVQAGVLLGELDRETQEFGLAVPAGIVTHTGLAGLTLGGGIGWLTRKAGLTADNLLSAEVVTADGRILRASADEHPDLYWALRGGGGNFGVVTRFEYQLHEVGPLVQLGLFFWGVDQGAEALRFSREFLKTVPEDMGTFLAGLSAPPEPFVPEQYRLAPGYALVVVGFGSAEDHARAIAPIRSAVPPLFELVTALPYTGPAANVRRQRTLGHPCLRKGALSGRVER